MRGSTPTEIDLTEDGQEPLPLEQLRAEAQEKISRLFASVLPAVASGVTRLALSAESEAVRLKASQRILDEFSPTVKQQSVPTTTVQILNQIPMPEYRAVNGKPADSVRIAGARVTLPDAPPLRTINPALESAEKKRYDGPRFKREEPVPQGPEADSIPAKALPPKLV